MKTFQNTERKSFKTPNENLSKHRKALDNTGKACIIEKKKAGEKMVKQYRERLAEKTLEIKLNSSGCVVVSGPKFCGKSTMCERFAKSVTPLKTTNAIELALADPRSALLGEKPHLIDEWQKAPEIWNEIKDDLDREYEFGKFILTGSTTPANPERIQHSGAGRITRMSLKPFTLYESGESTGSVSLSDLFRDPEKRFPTRFAAENKIGLSDIAFLICRGGWPVSVMAKKEYALHVTKNYYDGLFVLENESDEFAAFLKSKNIELLQAVLRSFARNISTQAKRTGMIQDILASGARGTLDDDTFASYERILKDLFIIFDLPAWNLNLRTSVSVRTAPTRHFVDTSIAAAALGINPADLMNDMKSFGYFFEDFAVRDLSVYAEAIGGELKHYRDSSGQEVDAIIELENGDYCAVEIKIASDKNISDGISSLNGFEKKVFKSGLKKPQFKMLLTSHGGCYRTEGGIFVVPISCPKN
ncbi:MAG: ATP-binding protein [Clostridia bacterium]|nr:ATP-binding protein [Clostridia bacterium]